MRRPNSASYFIFGRWILTVYPASCFVIRCCLVSLCPCFFSVFHLFVAFPSLNVQLLLYLVFYYVSESFVSCFCHVMLVLLLLCMRASLQDPAQFISAKVENIVSYGAFFGLDDGCSGFVHISQVCNW